MVRSRCFLYIIEIKSSMIIDNKIKIKINNKTLKYYKEKGYENIQNKDIIEINVTDLSRYSRELITIKCDNCDTIKTIRNCDYMVVYNKKNKYFCSKCRTESIKCGVKNKYGVDNVFQLTEVKEKMKKTNLKNLGVEYPTQNKEVFEKTKKTNKEKYGSEFIMQNKDLLNKQQNTNLEKYGTKYSFQNNEVKEKILNTNIKKYGASHPFKNKDVINKSILTKSNNLISNKYSEYNIIKVENNEYTIHCNKCDTDFTIDTQNFRNMIKYKTLLCTNCNNIGGYTKSGFEIELQYFIKDYYYNDILFGNRNIINPLELDIYLPDLRLAFEFNGVYWHNELYKSNNYHSNKTELCEKQGIQLIHIYEDDWLYKQEIVKSMILNKLSKNSNKIYARKTEIKEITDNKLIRRFLDANHIQGFVGSKVKIGLFYDNELISLMTFGNRRVAMGKKETNEDEYELLRFCNKINTNVIGGASKLFKYFVKNYNPNEITTYADRSHSQGNLYEILGFESQGKTSPNYYYVINGIKQYRFNYRKDILIKQGFDSNKTEHEIMLERKNYRIYDSGNLKFKYPKYR